MSLLERWFKSANMFIDNIFSWRPIEDQWWITGFNPEYKDEKADAKNQVMIGSVQFPNGEMYESIRNETLKDTTKNQYTVFDDNNKTVWICWCEEDLVK